MFLDPFQSLPLSPFRAPHQKRRASGPISILLRFLAALATSLLLAMAAPTLASAPAELDTLVPQLREGGLVIYLRHAATVHEQTKTEAIDLDRCETQRNLSAKGREQARQIGKAFRTLRIPVGEVISSPFCRCTDTAQLAFGHYSVDPDLHFAINLPAAERQRLAAALRDMLATPPKDGHNKIVVAHTANLREAADIWPKPEGVAHIFRPQGNGRFELVGRVSPGQWPRYVAGQD